ncbi:MAG TPA: DUF1501 domain-containing protein [Prosthecobacter sp.]|nr:DUF1501 domain-containing protein [Prosthecobacter sp.]
MNTQRELLAEYGRYRTRRWFFRECGVGVAGIAALDLMRQAQAAPSAANPLMPKKPHYPAMAKRVIYLFMGGAPSHLELFDNKPELAKWDGQLPPPDLLKGYRAAFINPNSKLLGPKYKFARHGQSGMEISELLPHTAKLADDLTVVKSMKTDAFNHAPAQILMSTGAQVFGRPSLAPGHSMAWARTIRICRVMWCCNRAPKAPAAAPRTLAAVSCLPCIRECHSAAVASRCSTSAIPRASPKRRSARHWTC